MTESVEEKDGKAGLDDSDRDSVDQARPVGTSACAQTAKQRVGTRRSGVSSPSNPPPSRIGD